MRRTSIGNVKETKIKNYIGKGDLIEGIVYLKRKFVII